MALIVKNPTIGSYFSSLSPLSQKFFDETEELRNSPVWDSLSAEQKEDLIDKFFIPENHSGDTTDELQKSDTLSPLKIKCGEKIVVDFENEDGWTWRDEHSGPFSWMTTSQQDLTLDEIYQEAANAKEKRQSKTPLPNSENIEHFIKGIDEPAFPIPATNEMSEIEAAFQKFGISIPTEEEPIDDVTTGNIEHIDIVINNACDVSDHSQNSTDYTNGPPFEVSASDKSQESSEGCKSSSDWSASSASSSPEHTQTKSARRAFNNLLKWPWGKKKTSHKSDAAFMSLPLTQPADDIYAPQDLAGHVSPVFESDEIVVVTSQPKKSTNHPIETYEQTPSFPVETYYNVTSSVGETFCDVQSQHETYDNIPESRYSPTALPSSGIVSPGAVSNDVDVSDVSSDEGVERADATVDPGVYIEPTGESADVTTDSRADTSQDSSFDQSKSGFDFLDNW